MALSHLLAKAAEDISELLLRRRDIGMQADI